MTFKTVLFAPTNKEAPVEAVVNFVAQQHLATGKKVGVLAVFEEQAEKLTTSGAVVKSAFPLTQAVVESANQTTDLLFDHLAQVQQEFKDIDVLLVATELHYVLGSTFNYDVATTLDAQIVVVDNTKAHTPENLEVVLEAFLASSLNAKTTDRLVGAVVSSPLSQLSEAWSLKLPLLATSTDTQNFVVVNELVKDFSKLPATLPRISPAKFRYNVKTIAAANKQRIVLPEGDEPRTIKAAAILTQRGLAECVLLAKPEDVARVAKEQEIELPEGLEIVDPAAIRDKYVNRLVELRKAKGMTEELAKQQLQDNVVVGTMMLEADEVAGLVSGAVHTTANTIRPPMQIIKTAPGAPIISSSFFMLLPEEVVVFADCAVNTNPNAEQLAAIAAQSAETAKAFGLDPRVAMISYSTLGSGSGADVDLVTEATKLAKEKYPELVIDGPLQFDAAFDKKTAALKAPKSPVAGKANVYVFTSLSCGNPLYKAVQQTSHVVAAGPLLQGMRKPVNDLSRGCTVEDIIYTVCLTSCQALAAKK